MQATLFGLVAAALAVAGCEQHRSQLDDMSARPGAAAPASTPPATTPPASTPHSAGTASGDTVSGRVVETMNVAGYTYARLDRDGTQVWIAGPETQLTVGTQLGPMGGTLMTGFHSDTLNRTFEQIYFVNAYNLPGTAAMPNPHTGSAPAPSAEPIEKVAPAPGGTTVADVFARKATLAGKPIVVRGKVVKLNNGILDRNWLHLRDGTGAAGSNDLLVTTQATVKLGDVVVARGKVTLDKDFGAGYKYAVLVEDATIASE